MKPTWFVIDTENNITAYPTSEEANANPNMRFAFADADSLETILQENEVLTQEIWNTIGAPGHALAGGPVGAARRIWKHIQSLAAACHQPAKNARVRATGTLAASKPPKPGKKAAAKKRAPKGKKKYYNRPTANASKPAKVAKPKKQPKGEQTGPRDGTKGAQLVEMLKHKNGATLPAIMKKFGWLAHTTRALLSAGGSLRKMGITVESFKPEGGERTYRISS